MRKTIMLTLLVLLAMSTIVASVYSDNAPKKAISVVPLTWRADGQGLYKFEETVRTANAEIVQDGSVATTSDEGICELKVPCKTEGVISTVSMNWTFTGKVTMEVSTTGKSSDYKEITNGVPLNCSQNAPGQLLKWRATMGLQSTLTEVRVTFTDLAGVVGSMGNPVLSNFIARREIFIKGSSQGPVYNFQVPIKVGESPRAGECDVYLEIPTKSDMKDIRFTQADGETSLPYWREETMGTRPGRSAIFWVKVPEIPKTGLPLYIYYGCPGADDLSDGGKVFDLFEDFNVPQLDNNKWRATLLAKTGQMDIRGSMLELDSVRAVSTKYNLTNGILEYRAKLTGGGNISGIVAAGSTADNDLAAYSSIAAASAHCIMKGAKVMANNPNQLNLDTFYNFRVISNNGEVTFQRYFNDWNETPQAQTQYSLGGIQPAAPIGISAGTGGKLYCDWIRTRKYANPPPQVDPNKTGKEEPTNIPTFRNLALAPDGSLILAAKAQEGEYISTLVRAPFEPRILTASWIEDASDAGPAKVSISTREEGNFYTGWQNGIARYLSKKEFQKGDQLRWRAKLYRQGVSPKLKKFVLAYQPGTIKVVMPAGGEAIMPGANYNIIWDAAGYDPSYGMNLYYSYDDGKTFEKIALAVPNSSSYTWAVPAEEAAKALIKVADSLDKKVYGVSGSFAVNKKAAEALQGEGTMTAEELKKAEEAKAAEEKAKEASAEAPAGAKLYDIIIKRVDAKEAKNMTLDSYEEGDIILIKPAGFAWGASDLENFLIVQAYLTDEEVEKYTAKQETITTKKGQQTRDIQKKRRYKMDLNKKELIDRRAGNVKGRLKGAPVSRSVIVDKNAATQ